MAAKLVPITPDVLRWAMRESQVTSKALAEKLGVEREEVRAWLSGDSQPGTTTFRKLATFLNRPTALFFLPEAPPDEVPAAFRRPPGEGDSAMTREESRFVRTAKRIQRVAAGVRHGLADPPAELPEMTSKDAPEDAAVEVRKVLGWSVADQLGAASKSAATRSLRSSLEAVGVLVLHFPMGDTRHRGFSFYDDWCSLVAANTNYNAEARSFTYVHELGHLLRRRDSFCGFDADAGIERWCEEFAAAFLLPRSTIRQYVQGQFAGEVTTLAQIKRTANHFKVSQTATAIRLANLDLGPSHLPALIDRSVDFKKSAGGPATGGKSAPELRLLSYGRSYAELLIDGEDRGVLRHHDLLNYLDVTTTQLGSVRSLLTSDLVLED